MTKKCNKPLERILRSTVDIAPRGECLSTFRAVLLNDDELEAGEPGLLRPGHHVRVDGLGANAVLVKSRHRLKPGTHNELQLLEQGRSLRGQIDRCRITRLDPLCYEAIFIFHQSVEIPGTHHA
jgi:hypothetical protein